MLQSMGLQRVRHNWVTEQQNKIYFIHLYASERSHFSPEGLCNPIVCSSPGSSVMGFSRQEYWNRLPFTPLGDLPNPGVKPGSPACRQILYHLTDQGSPAVRYSII